MFCDYSMLVTLYKIDEVSFPIIGREWKIYCHGLELSSELIFGNFTSFGIIEMRSSVCGTCSNDYFSSFNQLYPWFVLLPSSFLKLLNVHYKTQPQDKCQKDCGWLGWLANQRHHSQAKSVVSQVRFAWCWQNCHKRQWRV